QGIIRDHRPGLLALTEDDPRPGGDIVGTADGKVRRRVPFIGDGVVLHRDRLGETTPGTTLLRDDLDHTRRCIGAVQRSGRRALHDLDRLDVLRTEIVEPAPTLTTDTVDLTIARVRANTVDENQRLVGQRDRSRPTDPDRLRRPRRPRRLLDGDPRDSRLK